MAQKKLLDELSQIKNMTGLFSQARMRFIYFLLRQIRNKLTDGSLRRFVCCRWQRNEKALETYGFYADYMPKQFTTEALAKGLTDVVKAGEHLLLPRALQASEELV